MTTIPEDILIAAENAFWSAPAGRGIPGAIAAIAHALLAERERAAKLDGFYIASKAVHGPRWRIARGNGVPIISSWIDESEAGATSDWASLWQRCISEASGARALVLVRFDGEHLKGAWAEVGAALAAGVPVFAVGCAEFSIRHHPLFKECTNIEDAFERASRTCTPLEAKP